MKYYKVVRKGDTDLVGFFSAMYRSLPRELSVYYRPGFWVNGKLGPLFVFDNLDAAIDFRNKSFNKESTVVEVWEVEVKNPRAWKVALCVSVLRVWKVRGELKQKLGVFFKLTFPPVEFHMTSFGGYSAPYGTMVADSVRLIRRVDK